MISVGMLLLEVAQGQGWLKILLGSTLLVSIVGAVASLLSAWMQRRAARETRADTFNQARRAVYENYLKHLDTYDKDKSPDEQKKWKREYLIHSADLASVARKNVLNDWIPQPVYEEPENHFDRDERRKFVEAMNKDLNPGDHDG